jgi:hypothetical protein
MMTAWTDPGAPLATGAAVAGAPDCEAIGMGAWGTGTDGGEISGFESVSMLSHFESSIVMVVNSLMLLPEKQSDGIKGKGTCARNNDIVESGV